MNCTRDSLRRAIDVGLAHSRFGVVVLSPHFFRKEWSQRELDGLVARQTSGGGRVLLPIWLGISKAEVCEHSPTLADLVAIRAELGLDHVCSKVLQVVLLPKIKAVQDVIAQNPVPLAPASADLSTIQHIWVKTTQTLKTWYDAFAATSRFFDDDIRQRVDRAVVEYDSAYSAFRQKQDAEGTTNRILHAAGELFEVIPEAVEEQLVRLAEL
jgi:hypothetical protein